MADPSPPAHRVVFDLAVNESGSFQALLRNVANLRQALGPEGVEVRVVAYAGGLDLLLAPPADVAGPLDRLIGEGVGFYACQNSLRARRAGPQDLRPGSGTVDSGVAELVRLQERGFSYLKVASYPA